MTTERIPVTRPVRPWYAADPCTCAKPKSMAPDPSPAEQAIIDRFGIFDEDQGRNKPCTCDAATDPHYHYRQTDTYDEAQA